MNTVLGEVICRTNSKIDRFTTELEYYVGGDHINSDELILRNYGRKEEGVLGPMFYFGFKKGDVLLVSRNPHLRKACLATIDGICSEKTFVLGTKDQSLLLQSFIPIILQSDDFWKYAESHKSGSVNYFVNWSTLSNYPFNLPDIDTQK